jgi:hypothetical protein
MTVPDQQRQHGQRQQGRAHQRGAPVGAASHEGQEQRRQRPADIAADAVHRETMRQPRLGDALVQQGVIGRMEHAIAAAGDKGAQHQLQIAVRAGQQQRRHAQQRDAAEQHGARAQPVDHEAGHRLADAGDHEEHRHQQAQLGIAQMELRLQPRNQRRQDDMIKMRRAVRQPDQRDDFGVLPQ